MADLVFRLPDVGEGVAEAEIIEWLVAVGDLVTVDQPLVEVMTDKATVELPSPYAGRILSTTGDAGDLIAVGAELVRFAVEGDEAGPASDAAGPEPTTPAAAVPDAEAATVPDGPDRADPVQPSPAPAPPPRSHPAPTAAGATGAPPARPLASPSVRRRAADAGVRLEHVQGTGPAGRIEHHDLDAHLRSAATGGPVRAAVEVTTSTKVIGLRRKIAEQMSLAKRRIPHITYVDEVDLTALEQLRRELNEARRPEQPKLTILPFLVRALVRAGREVPVVNSTFDDEAGILHQHGAFHVGVAAQTPAGLVVPVLRHAEALDLWATATEIHRLAEAARAGTSTRDDLTGSTITISSLGAMGGLVTTPVINHPEVAIVGVNKLQVRPVWDGDTFVPRSMMNLSSSFDHRIVDGWDAAVFIQAVKRHLEVPALLFLDGAS